MYDNKGISVLLSFYNGKKFFSEQLQSIVKQLSINDELIIRDDGSDAEEFLRKTCTEFDLSRSMDAKKNIRIYSGKNIGVNESFHELLKRAKNDVCVFCDQDDIWTDTRLQSVRDNYFSDLHFVNYSINNAQQLDFNFSPNICRVFIRNNVPGCCMSGKKLYLIEAFEDIKNNVIYDHGLLFKSLVKKKNITFDAEIGVLYRRHENTVTKIGSFIPNGILEALRLRYALLKFLWK